MTDDPHKTMQEELYIGETVTIGGKEGVCSRDIVVERIAPGFHAVTVTLFTKNLTIDVDKLKGHVHLTQTEQK